MAQKGSSYKAVLKPPKVKPVTLIAFDPGDLHTGVCVWKGGKLSASEIETCIAPVVLEKVIGSMGVVVIESWELFPSEAASFYNQPLKTSELIGALRWIATKAGVNVAMQPPAVKKPTLHQCSARQIPWREPSIHAQDAKMHAVYWLLRNGHQLGTTRKRAKANG